MDPLFEKAFGAVNRTVKAAEKAGEPVRTVSLSRTYATTPADLWNALTDPERLPRWFLPVSGDLKPGGRYQLKGNAGGEILACDPPRLLSLTWEFGEARSWVDVTIAAGEGDTASLTLEHHAPEDDHWRQFGPGATGVGWDLAILGLGGHLGDAPVIDEAWMGTDAGKDFMRQSAAGWGQADIAGGEAEATAAERARQTVAFYTGEADA